VPKLAVKNLHVGNRPAEDHSRSELVGSARGGACHQGPNGSGKSTLAKVLAGHPDYHVIKGEVTMDGENILALEPDELAQF
jgi:Fe-S cluster assembly ATP-binding protein